MKIMVFDVGGTEIKYSVMDDQLNFYESGAVPTPMDTQEQFLDVIGGIYDQHKDEVEGIAMSLPGFIDAENGVVRGGGALRYNWGSPVGPNVSARCGGCKVVLENDGKAAAMAELADGALKGCRNASVFIIGTGVGGGLIVDGKVVRGRDCTAGEFSFVNVGSDKWESPDSVMALRCSTSALIGAYRAKKGLDESAPMDGRMFFADVLAGDAEAMEVLEAFARQIAIQIYNLSVLLNVEKVAIGGGISKQPILTQKIDEAYSKLMQTFVMGPLVNMLPRPEIVTCKFNNDANKIGALYSYLAAK